MKSDVKTFDSASLSLEKGTYLIEASAGTGKTFAIGMFVLRFVAELGIPIEKILVVTFTKAATDELRGRIRSRLVEARNLLDGGGQATDETIKKWVDSVKDKKTCADRLQLALLDIDRAGICTIHSFCQRILQEQALESGQLFDLELLVTTSDIQQELAEDFWRKNVYGLSKLPCTLLATRFTAPDDLLESIGAGKAVEARIEPSVGSIEKSIQYLEDCYREVEVWWRQHSTSLYTSFIEGLDYFKVSLSAQFYSWWKGVDGFFYGDQIYPENLEYLTSQGLVSVLNGTKLRGDEKKKAFLAPWILPDEEVENLLKAAEDVILTIRVTLANTLRDETQKRLSDLGVMSFNSLISSLEMALRKDESDQLKNVLKDRYDVALIDEFQDTDAKQWFIFKTIFGGNSHYLYLIGDPKQAIYRFRGADIYAYFEARKKADSNLSLALNYRTHPRLVSEVNRLFLSRENPFHIPELPYNKILAAKQAEDGALYQDHRGLANMVYCQLPGFEGDKQGRWTSSKASEQFLRFTVAEISRLLNNKSPVTLRNKEKERPISPMDIAILVRTNSQAEDHLTALSSLGIPAVVVSKKSVFHTEECRELFVLLQALINPMDSFKSGMAISWFGFTGNQLHDIWHDDPQFDTWYSRFTDYYHLWKSEGFLNMMKCLLDENEVFAVLATQQSAERRIANIQHLLEIIQEQETLERFGPIQTLKWLHSVMIEESRQGDVELRLESDEEAVRVLTMHGAKGLEFPIVFCPHLWFRSKPYEKNMIASCYDQGWVMDFGTSLFKKRRELSLAEEHAEELRLLYVALTRAALCCYTMWADVKPIGGVADSFSSALGYLLFPEGRVTHEEQHITFEKICHSAVEQLVVSEELCEPTPFLTKRITQEKFTCEIPSNRKIHTDWHMTSYSTLANLSEFGEIEKRGGRDDKEKREKISSGGLPAGANFGSLVHDVLEKIPFTDLSDESVKHDLISDICLRYGIDVDQLILRRLLSNTVTTPLLAKHESSREKQFILANFAEDHCLMEMPFYFHLEHIRTGQINSLLRTDPAFVPLSHRAVEGYLTGFIDLVCSYDHRYYILDYKTNHLGDYQSDYSPDKLVLAMAEHNYGLQYWIYTLVLHRHLAHILPHYSYQKHFGGVLYLFVRGMQPELPASGVYHTRPDFTLLRKLDACLGGNDD